MNSMLPIALRAVDLAADVMTSRAPGRVIAKGDRDMVSEVDLEVERRVRDFLRRETPEIAFLGEEDGGRGAGDAELTWTLDPVDGTANFIHGLPLCAISLALVQRESPVVGVVTLPLLNRTYEAAQGCGARCNGGLIQVSGTDQLIDAVIATGDYAVGPHASVKNERRFALSRLLADRVQRIRMLGSAAIDLVWVAEGLLDGCVALSNKPWDVAAGVIIAREAGAQVVDLTGRSHGPHSAATVAVTPGIARELIDVIRPLAR
jgi:myo-inositol-1(or 4)-monophosphatase